jgi:hypothetical protein
MLVDEYNDNDFVDRVDLIREVKRYIAMRRDACTADRMMFAIKLLVHASSLLFVIFCFRPHEMQQIISGVQHYWDSVGHERKLDTYDLRYSLLVKFYNQLSQVQINHCLEVFEQQGNCKTVQ